MIKPLSRAELTEFAIRRLAKKYPELVREKWDFSKCPDEELADCWLYELKSESPYARQQIASWRQTCNAKTFDEFLYLAHRTLTWVKYGQFYALCPEWPDDPYLSVLSTERKRRRELFGPNTKSRAAELTSSPAVPGKLSQPEVDFMLELIGQSAVKYVTFRIDCQKSRREIQRTIAAWLKINCKCKAKPNVSHRTLRADLKALGSHRILETTVGEWRDAPELYWYHSDWIKADKRAKKLIKKIDALYPL